MHYLVSVCRDRIQAEEVYSAIESAGLPMQQVSILGRGYKSADEYGLTDPVQQGRKQAKLMAYWLLPFGFFAGVGFSVITDLHTFAWAGEIGNHFIGGILGAIAAGMGSVFVGGGATVAFASGDSLPYRNRLDEGKYLVIVKGEEVLVRQAQRISQQFNPEHISSYSG